MEEQIKFDLKVMDDTDSFVFKSHNLIESGYNLTLNEQRLLYLASKKIKPRYIKSNLKPSEMTTLLAHITFKDLKIHVNEFKKEFNLNSNNLYSVLKDTSNKLYERSIQYLQDNGVFTKKRWVTTCKYNQAERYIELTFHPDLILDLLIIKGRFGKMEYNATKSFKTTYAFRIYELLQNYAYKGTREFELSDLRYKLGIYDDNKYKQFGDFKKYVLNNSIKSINESTNLNVSYKENRRGRKIGTIEFSISQKTLIQDDIIVDNEEIDISQVKKMENIIGIELSAGLVEKLTNIIIDSIRNNKIDMGFYEYLEYEMNIVNKYSQNKEVNILACLQSALKEYWQETPMQKQNTNKFINFEPREYDYNDLEWKLLGWDKNIE